MPYSEGKKPDIVEKAKKCLRQALEAESSQRKRETAALRFQVGENQWDEAAKRQRQGDLASAVPIPPRPMLSINKIDQPVQLIMNQARSAKLGVNIHPVSEDADKEGAEIRQGLYRRIERDSNANLARLWALDRATKAGRGVYRVNTKWDEDSDSEGPGAFDQEIVIERVLNQESVYFDPAAKKPDFSDGEWVIVAVWMSEEEFRRTYPNANLSKEDILQARAEWTDLAREMPDWVKAEGDERSVLVAEYWYKEHKITEIKAGGRTRKRDDVTVTCCTVTGLEEIERYEWNGKLIPFIPVIGRELIPFDSERRWVGMIEPAMDSQRAFNYAASSAIEGVALEPKAPFVAAAGSFEGYEAQWQQANIRNFPFLEYNPQTIDGNQAPPPQRAQVDGGKLNLSMQLMQTADHWLQASTSVYDPSLGRDNPRDKSGKAILALQQQSDAGTSHYLSSLADISMTLEAKIILDLMPAIYDRPGRITTILRGDDDEAEHVMLNQPFVKGPQGFPQAAQNGPQGPPQPPGAPGMPGMPPQPKVQQFDLSKGKYGIAVDIGKSFQTRLQAGQEALTQIVQADPNMMMIMGDLLFRFSDSPGSTEIADRMKKVIAQKNPGLLDQNDPGQQAEQENQALKGQMQEMQQIMQQMDEALKTDKVKAEAEVEKARIKADTDLQLQEMRNAASIAVAEINARSKGVLSAMEAEHEALATGLKNEHEMQMAQHDTAHDVAMANMQHQAAQEAAAEGAALNADGGQAPVPPEPTPPAAPPA